MIKFFIAGEEIVCSNKIQIKEEMLATSSTILNNCYPKSWEKDKDYVSRFYLPKDYSRCDIYDFDKPPRPIYGIGKQKTTKGYQLFDESKLPTKTQNGVTLTNNRDGSFTISGSGNPTANFNYNYNYTHEETVELLKAGNITISDNGNTEHITSPYFLAQLRKSSGVIFEISNRALNVNTNIITQEMLDDESTILRIGFYGSANQIITPSTVKPMLFQEGDGKFEKFTGGKPSPNLDYPQEIETLKGTKNLFNGILKLGSINNNTGDYESSNNCIMGEQYIEVIPNNKYSISTSENYSIFVHFYDIDKNYISYDSTQKTPKIITIPDNCYYIRIRTRQAEKITDLNSKIQVEKGEINHDYVPFGSWLKLTTKFEEYKEKEYLIDMNKENLFNKDNLQINKLVNEQGILLDDTRYNSTDFIGVTNEISIYFDGKINNYNKMFVSEYDKNKNFIRRQTNSITTKLQQYFELDDNTQYIIFSYRHDVEMSNIRIYKGYGQNYELAGINDIKDELIVDDLGNVSLEKRIEKIIINSSHVKNYTAINANTIRFDLSVLIDSAVVSRNKIMCDSLFVQYGDTSDTEHIRNSDSRYPASLCLYINKDRLEDTSNNTAIINSFKNYLDNHKIIVYYQLKEAQTIKRNKINLIHEILFSGAVKNTGNISLNPRYPKYADLQILDFKTFLSEGDTLEFVISNKTIKEAIEMVTNAIRDYGFIVGNIKLTRCAS